jgi:hypothetical protein
MGGHGVAASDFIKSLIEPAMRQALTEVCGCTFGQRKMPVLWNGEGTGSFEFDAVSENGRIVACLSTARKLNPGQRHTRCLFEKFEKQSTNSIPFGALHRGRVGRWVTYRLHLNLNLQFGEWERHGYSMLGGRPRAARALREERETLR